MRVKQWSQLILGFGTGKEIGFYSKCSGGLGEFEVLGDMIWFVILIVPGGYFVENEMGSSVSESWETNGKASVVKIKDD